MISRTSVPYMEHLHLTLAHSVVRLAAMPTLLAEKPRVTRKQAALPGIGRKKKELGALQFVSLFSGCGGLDLGFERAGFTPSLALELDEAAITTYAKRRPGARILKKDLSNVAPGYVSERLDEIVPRPHPIGVVGGPPCQAFSFSNVHKKSDDPRLTLPISYAAILKELNRTDRLDFFVFENVVGIASKAHEEQFRYFKQLFGDSGFRIFEKELNALHFGVPQDRRRVFVVGVNGRRFPHAKFEFPTPQDPPYKTVVDVLGNLPDPVFFNKDLTPGSIPFHANHWCMNPRSDKFDGRLKEGHVKGRPFRVLAWNMPSWTVAYGHREVHVHPSGRRRLSMLEAMLLQGFPIDYELVGTLSDQIRLVSDAVPPPLAEALANAVKRFLEEYL
jgi:DNA (cytosine-5)-methyltransferase 1